MHLSFVQQLPQHPPHLQPPPAQHPQQVHACLTCSLFSLIVTTYLIDWFSMIVCQRFFECLCVHGCHCMFWGRYDKHFSPIIVGCLLINFIFAQPLQQHLPPQQAPPLIPPGVALPMAQHLQLVYDCFNTFF